MGGGAAGLGQWAGGGSSTLTCSPRKFSEKIALHNQRQAEDTAAFQEVMMDITTTRVSQGELGEARTSFLLTCVYLSTFQHTHVVHIYTYSRSLSYM